MRIHLNWVDRAIAVVAPNAAITRAKARVQLHAISEHNRAYDAGKRTRSTAGWNTPAVSSADSEGKYTMSLIRERSRDLVMNNPYAKKAVQVITTNTIGTGIRPSIPKNSGISKPTERRIMAAWRKWAESTKCDFNGQLNVYGIMMQAWRAAVESGDGLIRIVRDASVKPIPLKLQLLEADFLDSGRDGQTVGEGNYIVAGVEYNQAGKRVAYWLFDRHPAESMPYSASLISKRIPADEIIHIYEILRPGQTRGIPMGVAAFLRLRNLDDYEDAQLIRQKIAACFSVFITKTDSDFTEDYEKSDSVINPPPLSEKLSSGMIEYLAPGEKVEFADPPGTTHYDEYTRTLLRSIAIAYGITYESLTGDLTGVNFSSGRMGWLEMHRQITQWQDMTLIPQLCCPIWDAFIHAFGIAVAQVDEDLATAVWTPPRREMIDPVKEAQGMMILIRLGLMSKSEAIRLLGGDPEAVLAEIVQEQKDQDAQGMMLESDPKHDANRVNFGKEAYLASKQPKAKSPDSKKTTSKM